MKVTRRQFVIYSVSGVGTLCLGAAAQAQAMVSETDPQAVAVGYKADTKKWTRRSFQSTRRVRNALTVPCIRARPQPLRPDARSFLASK